MAGKQEVYFSKARAEAFSDGIFAIIVTLLVLEIKVPALKQENSVGELARALWAMLPKILSWAVSFLMVCVIWVNHHRMFMRIKTVNHKVLWLNAVLLLWCSFIPFPTALIGDYLNNPLAQSFFGLIMAAMSTTFFLLRMYLLKRSHLLVAECDLESFRKASWRTLFFGTMLYVLGAVLSFWHPYAAFVLYALIPLYFILF